MCPWIGLHKGTLVDHKYIAIKLKVILHPLWGKAVLIRQPQTSPSTWASYFSHSQKNIKHPSLRNTNCSDILFVI